MDNYRNRAVVLDYIRTTNLLGIQKMSLFTSEELPSEKVMREVYVEAFGQEYDAPTRKQPPLPLDMAYFIADRRLKREERERQ